jgi:MerR family transcriptional regulator/heat shock protein HspR
MSRDSSVSVFVISVAAQLSDMHPQTLRNYEREGLIEPTRTSGGNRMYSEDDLTLLAEIADLTAQGLNVAGIKKVFALRSEVARLSVENQTLRILAGPDGAQS